MANRHPDQAPDPNTDRHTLMDGRADRDSGAHDYSSAHGYPLAKSNTQTLITKNTDRPLGGLYFLAAPLSLRALFGGI